MSSLRHMVRDTVNSVLGAYNLELKHHERDHDEYIPLEQTLAGARAAGLSVGDYIDMMYNVPGSTQETMDNMRRLGVFDRKLSRICEIGPGSGRYLEKTLQICKPDYYEIYETAKPWAQWLTQQYDITLQPTDGFSLAATPSSSIDLVHAHKVFPGLRIMTLCEYMYEIGRVLKDGGKVVFDLLTEECLQDEHLIEWRRALLHGGNWPHTMMAKQVAIDIFCRQNFTYDGSFIITMKPAITEYFVFTKGHTAQQRSAA